MKTTVGEILKSKGHYICNMPPTSTIKECIQKMNQEKIGSIAIIENDQLVGLFTERDVLTEVFGRNIDPDTTPVSEVMTKDIIYAKSETTIDEVMATFTARRFRHLPVIEGGKLIGIISIGDTTKWIINSQQSEIRLLSDYIYGMYR